MKINSPKKKKLLVTCDSMCACKALLEGIPIIFNFKTTHAHKDTSRNDYLKSLVLHSAKTLTLNKFLFLNRDCFQKDFVLNPLNQDDNPRDEDPQADSGWEVNSLIFEKNNTLRLELIPDYEKTNIKNLQEYVNAVKLYNKIIINNNNDNNNDNNDEKIVNSDADEIKVDLFTKLNTLLENNAKFPKPRMSTRGSDENRSLQFITKALMDGLFKDVYDRFETLCNKIVEYCEDALTIHLFKAKMKTKEILQEPLFEEYNRIQNKITSFYDEISKIITDIEIKLKTKLNPENNQDPENNQGKISTLSEKVNADIYIKFMKLHDETEFKIHLIKGLSENVSLTKLETKYKEEQSGSEKILQTYAELSTKLFPATSQSANPDDISTLTNENIITTKNIIDLLIGVANRFKEFAVIKIRTINAFLNLTRSEGASTSMPPPRIV